jgi:hypothetical protein
MCFYTRPTSFASRGRQHSCRMQQRLVHTASIHVAPGCGPISFTAPWSIRQFHAVGAADDQDNNPRHVMPFDILIVGGGPAGLAAAIRVKQLCQEHNCDYSVCLIDKGRYVPSSFSCFADTLLGVTLLFYDSHSLQLGTVV